MSQALASMRRVWTELPSAVPSESANFCMSGAGRSKAEVWCFAGTDDPDRRAQPLSRRGYQRDAETWDAPSDCPSRRGPATPGSLGIQTRAVVPGRERRRALQLPFERYGRPTFLGSEALCWRSTRAPPNGSPYIRSARRRGRCARAGSTRSPPIIESLCDPRQSRESCPLAGDCGLSDRCLAECHDHPHSPGTWRAAHSRLQYSPNLSKRPWGTQALSKVKQPSRCL